MSQKYKSMKPPAMKKGDAGIPPMPPAGGKTGEAPKDAPKPTEGKPGFSKAPNKAGIGDASLTIVISCKEGSELDAGLAVQNMAAVV